MKRSVLGHVILSLLLPLLLLGFPSTSAADLAAELATAQQRVREGRTYHVGFPGSKTRKSVRELFLGVDDAGQPTPEGEKYGPLRQGMEQAIEVRTDERKVLTASSAETELAQTIAWEALESILQGQLIAGNANLLKGLRVAFPGAGGGEKPGGEETLPPGFPSNSQGNEYMGSNIIDLCYAQLHFFRGLATAIDFMNLDSTGELRAVDRLNTPEFPQYTVFYDPNFDDGSGTEPQSIQTAAYLLGNILDRYGKGIVGMADRLWRAAYFDKARAPGGSRQNERQEMLDAAVAGLQQGIHSQFMAVLPLAATLSDGEYLSGENEFQLCRLDQVRASAATAESFIDRIRRGEVPKIGDLSLHSSTTNINNILSLVASLKHTADQAYEAAQAAIWKTKEGEAEMVADAQAVRWRYSDQLYFKSGLQVGEEGQEPYFGLTTEAGRRQYRRDVAQQLRDAMSCNIDDPFLTNSGDIGIYVLRLRQAMADFKSAKNRVDAIPQQIRIEEERVGATKGVLLGTAEKITAYQLGMNLANSVSVNSSVGVSFGPPTYAPEFNASVGVSYTPGWGLATYFQNSITRAEALQQVRINNIEAQATIRNLLLQQHQYILDMESAVTQCQLAIADINALLGEIETFINSHIYFQDSNKTKWHYDPALIFEQEEAEISYEDALREYVRELYKLSQLLAARWSEPYENPYLKADGVPATLGGGIYDGFTQCESIFNVYKASEATSFYLALKAWDAALRSQRLGGQADVDSVISLRQDILGLSDVVWNAAENRFDYDAALHEENVRRFKAFMLSSAMPDSPDFWLRVDFPLTYNQLSRSVVGPSQTPIVRAVRTDWNIRMTELSAEILGTNVAPGAPNDRYRIDLYQYGKIEIPKFHPRRTDVYPNFLTYNLPLYYPDPAEESISPFQYSLQAGINAIPGIPNTEVSDREPTPFCSRWVLLIFRSAGPLNIQNVEDIKFKLNWRSGIPPTFNWPL